MRVSLAALLLLAGATGVVAEGPISPSAPPATTLDPTVSPAPSGETTGSIDPAAPGGAAPVPVATDDWIGVPVVSADGVTLGRVASVETGPTGEPVAVTAEVGGILGFGASQVRLPVGAANFDGAEVRIGMVETDVQSLIDGDRDALGVAPE